MSTDPRSIWFDANEKRWQAQLLSRVRHPPLLACNVNDIVKQATAVFDTLSMIFFLNCFHILQLFF